MSCVRRVVNVVVIALTVVVIAAAVYVVRQNDPVPGAGTVPSDPPVLSRTSSAPPSSRTSGTATSRSASGTSRTSSSATATGSVSGSNVAVRTAFLGDNYTAGAGASTPTKSWASVLTDQLDLVGKRFSVSGGGYAKPGDGGRTYLSLVDSVVAYHPDLVVVSGGRNDTADDPSTLADKTNQLFDELRAKLPKAKIVAIKPWWGDSPHPEELSTVDDAVRAAVTAVKGTYLAVDDPLVGHADWMADGANPNDAGYRKIADSVASALRRQDLVQ